MIKYYMFGEITEEVAVDFLETMDDFENTNDDHKIVEIVMNSSGGCYESSMAIIDRIRTTNVEVNCRVVGRCMSMALLICAACDQRISTPPALFMYHEIASNPNSFLNITDQRNLLSNTKHLQNVYDEMLKTFTNNEKILEQFTVNGESYFGTKIAKEIGIIDYDISY